MSEGIDAGWGFVTDKMIDYLRYFDKLRQVETFQSRIDDLYAIHSILRDKIRGLKIERDILLLRIEKSLNSEDWEGEEYNLRKALFKDKNVPIARSYYDRLSGEENAEATDWEADEVSSEEEWVEEEVTDFGEAMACANKGEIP